MEIAENPSIFRNFLRILREPFSMFKERWLHYFARFAEGDDTSDSSMDVREQPNQDVAEEKRQRDEAEEKESGGRKRKSSVQNETHSRAPSDHSTQEEKSPEKVPKEDKLEEMDLEKNFPMEYQTRHTISDYNDGPDFNPGGRPKMKFNATMVGIGTTIGLSHLWRFPNMAYKVNSGNFIIIYSLLILLFGYPLYFATLTRGQYSSQSALKVFERIPLMQGVGISMIMLSYITIVYQMQTIGFGIHYFVSSFQLELPWAKCDPSENGTFSSLCYEPWNFHLPNEITRSCRQGNHVNWDKLCTTKDPIYRRNFLEGCCGSRRDTDPNIFANCENMYRNYCLTLVPAALHYWNLSIVRPHSNDDPPSGVLDEINLKLMFCSVGAGVLLYGIVTIGLKRTAYISMFVVPLMLAFFIFLLASTMRFPGSLDGLLRFIKPKICSLTDVNIWFTAVEQSLYSLGLGMGLVITIGYISPFNNASHKTALAVTFSVLAANLISASLLYAAAEDSSSGWSRPLNIVFEAGVGTSFVVFSYVLAQLPFPWLFSCIFFALFTMTGACSIGGLLSSISLSIADVTRVSTRDMYVVNFIIVFSCFLLGMPIIMREGLVYIEALDTVAATFSIPVIVFLEIATLFMYGFRIFCEDTAFMLGFNPIFFLLPVCVIICTGIAAIVPFKFLQYEIPKFGIWAKVSGFGSLGLILIPIILTLVVKIVLVSMRSSLEIPRSKLELHSHRLMRQEFKNKQTRV